MQWYAQKQQNIQFLFNQSLFLGITLIMVRPNGPKENLCESLKVYFYRPDDLYEMLPANKVEALKEWHAQNSRI